MNPHDHRPWVLWRERLGQPREAVGCYRDSRDAERYVVLHGGIYLLEYVDTDYDVGLAANPGGPLIRDLGPDTPAEVVTF